MEIVIYDVISFSSKQELLLSMAVGSLSMTIGLAIIGYNAAKCLIR